MNTVRSFELVIDPDAVLMLWQLHKLEQIGQPRLDLLDYVVLLSAGVYVASFIGMQQWQRKGSVLI